jgi:hypothetical protein
MAKIRAYKLAEELGLDRTEFVERAAEAGVELRSAMASLDEDAVELLREKLGGPKPGSQVVTERRVQRGSGAAVIRRRKKAAEVEAPPVEELLPEGEVASEAPPAAAEPGLEEIVPPVSETPVEESIAAEADQAPAFAPAAQATPVPAPAREAAATARPAPERPAGPDRSGRQRKLVREVVNLREQERLAVLATCRAPLRRHVAVV